jgi:molybdopterin-dependent oxidoreductase alpha subunit
MTALPLETLRDPRHFMAQIDAPTDAPAPGQETHHYDGAVGGWGSLKGLSAVVLREKPHAITLGEQLLRQNKPGGFMCVSCSWSKPAEPNPAEFCENGAKATAWDLTRHRCTPDFFAEHTLTELRGWPDFDLEHQGRLTSPMRYDPTTDKYIECAWETAFAEIGRELKALDPKSVIFYASGRASLETSYMYGLFARMYGCNNLPDSSNMCHESTSVGLKQSIGSPVGTIKLKDFQHTDCILFFGQNVGSNSPRMLHELQPCARRGVPIITFNPLRERGLEKFTNPQSPLQMVTGSSTSLSTQYHQLRAGSDIAAMTGMCKWLIERDDAAMAAGGERVLDHAFIREYTSGYDAFAAFCRAADWADIERETSLSRADIEAAASVYASSKAVILVYGMGLTQHRFGVQNVHMACNLLLLRGNIGKPGAGPCPVRGHSNVQGQRTVGITEKPELAPLDKLAQQFGFEPPRDKGRNTVEACEGILNGEISGFVSLGGNFVRAIPDTERMEHAWRKLRLSVQVATKLNRSHLVPGEVTYLLPCLSRIERDVQASGSQIVTAEDSTSVIHASFGEVEPSSKQLLSETRIVAELAKATLRPNPKLDWEAWTGDYSKVRDAIAETYPQWFADFNAKLSKPGGFYRSNKARKRDFSDTQTGRAMFFLPGRLSATGFSDEPGVLRLMTLRSNDQFNTTIYGYEDRLRDVSGTRDIVFMNPEDIKQFGLTDGATVGLSTQTLDGICREKHGLKVFAYNIPRGCLGAYYPECNVLVPLAHHAEESKVPAGKSVPVRIIQSRHADCASTSARVETIST